MTLTRYGLKEWGLALLAALAASVIIYLLFRRFPSFRGWYISAAAVVWVIFLAFAAFFRNPSRELPADERLLASPADGVVKDIEVVDFDQEPFKGKALRVGIFLSVFNVHVNRTPARMQVRSKVYRPGRYLDARNPECAKENEAMTICGEAEAAGKRFPLGIRQISGAIARRIVCPVQPGTSLKRGEVYGMIKFGSRTELYLPAEGFEVKVKIGDAVRGGETVIAGMK